MNNMCHQSRCMPSVTLWLLQLLEVFKKLPFKGRITQSMTPTDSSLNQQGLKMQFQLGWRQLNNDDETASHNQAVEQCMQVEA